MTSNAPWSVKGIDPKAREAAKELARQSGMTLGEWLNHSIRQHGEGLRAESRAAAPARGPKLAASADISEALQRLTDRIEAAEQRSTLAVTGIDQSVRGMLTRLETSEREQVAVSAHFEGVLQDNAQVQAAINARLAKLEDQAAGPRSAEALKSLEGALGRVATHLYEGESRTRDTLADLKRDMGALAGRVEAAERGSGGLADAVAARVAANLAANLTERLEQAENRTSAAMRSLERSFAQLDLRMATVEHQVDGADVGEARQRLETLAADLTAKIEASRTELAAKLGEAGEARFDRMDRTIGEMAAHIQASERRSAQALETMGQEVLRMADSLSRRVQGVEHRSADAIEKVGGEVSRVVSTLEGRFGRSEAAQAQALEKLGGEIARITERLSERIGSSERRAAQAIDDVGEQVTRATERLNQRYDRASSDLAERIRQSEERTARLLEDAKDRIDQRLSEGQRKLTEQAAAPAPRAAPAPAFPDNGFSDPFAAPPFGQALSQPLSPPLTASTTPPPVIYPDAAPFGQTFAPAGFALAEPEFDSADMDAANNFPPVSEAVSEADFIEPVDVAEDRYEPLDVPEFAAEHIEAAPEATPLDFSPTPARNLSTRELIEQARAAARNASQAQESAGRKAKPGKEPKPPKGDGEGRGIPFVTRKKRNNTMRTALVVSGTAASVALMAAGGMMFYTSRVSGEGSAKMAGNSPETELLSSEADTTPRAAIALNPTPITGDAAAVAMDATETANAARMHAEGSILLQAQDLAGLDMVRRAANLGYPKAQFELGSYYEAGKFGLTKNLVEARRWYERAAAGGQDQAMHNLGLSYYEGRGGPKNLVVAAQWFRRAADMGLNDSQYNLARLYENGLGVDRNPAEAYKWYLIAARGGTAEAQGEARAAAARVRAGLSAAAQSLAERTAATYTASPANATTKRVEGPATALSLSSAQKALGRLGYYRGAEDGQDSTALRLAIRSFQRDQALVATGQIDTATASRLTSYNR